MHTQHTSGIPFDTILRNFILKSYASSLYMPSANRIMFFYTSYSRSCDTSILKLKEKNIDLFYLCVKLTHNGNTSSGYRGFDVMLCNAVLSRLPA